MTKQVSEVRWNTRGLTVVCRHYRDDKGSAVDVKMNLQDVADFFILAGPAEAEAFADGLFESLVPVARLQGEAFDAQWAAIEVARTRVQAIAARGLSAVTEEVPA